MARLHTWTRGEDFPESQETLRRLEEVQQLVHELAHIILPSLGEFTSVWDITNQVVDHYYHPRAA